MLRYLEKNFEIVILNDYQLAEPFHIAFYKVFYKGLKNLTCLSNMKSCHGCKKRKECVYSYLSFENFRYKMSPLVVSSDNWGTDLKRGDRIKLNVIFLGNSLRYKNYFDFFVEQVKTEGLFKSKLFCNVIQSSTMNDKSNLSVEKLEFDRNILISETKELFLNEYIKHIKLNERYEIFDNCNEERSIFEYSMEKEEVGLVKTRIGECLINIENGISSIKFNQKINKYKIEEIMKIGFGEAYFWGFGRVKEEVK